MNRSMTGFFRVNRLACLGMALCFALFVVRAEGTQPAVAAGHNHSLILRSDGSLRGMGVNWHGQLGDGTNVDRNTSVLIDQNVTAIAAGGSHSFYTKSNGSLRAMGGNWSGQLGDGTTSDRNSSVLIDQNVTAIAAGGSHSFYLKSDGSLRGMGRNWNGQLGDGTNVDRNTSVLIDNNVTAIAVGGGHSMYLKSNGSLRGMGSNWNGQLGDGTTTDRNTSVLIDQNVTAIAAGYYHSLYLKSDGSLRAMGCNSWGQLGDGTNVDRNTSVLIDLDVTAIAADGNHSLYLKSDGSLRTMGQNTFGQLGDGTLTARNSSVLVLAATHATLTLNAGTGGSVAGAGNYVLGTDANLTATPSPGYVFTSWTGDLNSTDASASVTMNANKEINATFGPDTVDNDGDGVTNYREIVQLGSDPDDNDTDDDGLNDGTEDQWGLNPAVADTALMTFFANRETTARAEGNATGIAFAQAKPNPHGLFTESDRIARMTQAFDDGLAEGKKVGYARHLAESRYAFSKEGIELSVTGEAIVPKPHTYDWYFQPGFGWVWTNQAIFPHLYLYDSETGGGSWHYFDPYGNRSAPYYDQSAEKWKDLVE